MIVEFSDRVGWVLLGMALGYIIRLLQDMKKEVEEVDQILTEREQRKTRKRINKSKRDEMGAFKLPKGRTIAIAVALLLCFYATVSTGSTNNKLENAISDIKASQNEDVRIQQKLARVTVCTQEYLSKTITALNERTEFTQAQATANVRLQQAQNDFLQIFLLQPPASEKQVQDSLNLYVARLQSFVEVAEKNRNKTATNAYPKAEELQACLVTKTGNETVSGG